MWRGLLGELTVLSGTRGSREGGEKERPPERARRPSPTQCHLGSLLDSAAVSSRPSLIRHRSLCSQPARHFPFWAILF